MGRDYDAYAASDSGHLSSSAAHHAPGKRSLSEQLAARPTSGRRSAERSEAAEGERPPSQALPGGAELWGLPSVHGATSAEADEDAERLAAPRAAAAAEGRSAPRQDFLTRTPRLTNTSDRVHTGKNWRGGRLRHRPGVAVREGSGWRDEFKIIKSTFSGVFQRSSKWHDPKRDTKESLRLPEGSVIAVNLVPAKSIDLESGPSLCVMAWYTGKGGGGRDDVEAGTGWVPVDAIDRGQEILTQLKKDLEEGELVDKPVRIEELERQVKNKEIRRVRATRGASEALSEMYVSPRQRSEANKVKHYLPREGRCYLNANLPSAKVAAIAADVLLTGEEVAVLEEKSKPIYGPGADRSDEDLKWAYCAVVSDPTRRGWIPLRALEP